MKEKPINTSSESDNEIEKKVLKVARCLVEVLMRSSIELRNFNRIAKSDVQLRFYWVVGGLVVCG